MAEKKDKYLEWVEQGKLRQKLNATHILVKCDVKEVDIAKYLDITVKEYKKLKEKYPEFNKAGGADKKLDIKLRGLNLYVRFKNNKENA